MDEDQLFAYAPSASVTILNVGTRAGKTTQNIINFVLGKSFEKGRIFTGFFSGNHCAGRGRQGWMIGISRTFVPKISKEGEPYYKWEFDADFASGKGILGGGGCGITYYFNPHANIQTGPVWFNSAKLYGTWKWFFEIGIDMPLLKRGWIIF